MAIAMYNGNEPYIFVSYAHKNSDVVLPIIEALANNGFRVWYDAGIKAGVDYTEDIANRIKNSAVVIVFVSKALIQSEFCHNEIKYAVSKKKKMLLIYIEDVELTPGLEMILGFTQALFYNRLPYGVFLQELMAATILAPCRSAIKPAATAPKPVASPLSDFEIENGVLKKYVGKATSLVIPDGVMSIGEHAFAECSSLTRITIPDSVTSIGDSAFYECSRLTSITIPDSVTSIGEDAFRRCSRLTSITISDGVTSIEGGAFSWCTNLTSITIPDSVTSIGENAFWGCSSLMRIAVDRNNPVYHSAGNCLIETTTGILIVGCMNSVIPDYVMSIDTGAFSGCSGLTNITIPNSVTSIGRYAFYGCLCLTSITIPNGVTSIDVSAFRGCSGLIRITIPNSVTSIGEGAFSECSRLTSIAVGRNNPVYHSAGNCLIEIATGKLIAGCVNSVIPDYVTSIGEGTFSGCSGLTNITIPDSVTSIGENAFWGCSSLTSIMIPDRVKYIGKGAFSRCSSLIIYCQATSKPDGWKDGQYDSWNPANRPVVWGWKE